MKESTLIETPLDPLDSVTLSSLPSDEGLPSNGVTPNSLPAVHEPLVETRWHTLSLSGGGLVPNPEESLALRGPITLREEVTPPAFGHLFATLERHTAGLTVIGVTSAVPGEGKTTVALHLSRSAAESSYRRVCLVDLSLGEDELCRRVGAAPAPGGVVSFLESEGPLSVLQWPGDFQLAIFAAGKAPVNPARTARSPRIPELIAALRDDYDLVIVDLPSVSSDNATPIARHLDGSVFVARAAATPRRVINTAMDAIGRENLVGIILNQVTPTGKRGRTNGFSH